MTEETINKVLDVTMRLFTSQGYSKTQIAQIASMAGIATGSMYHLFENKKALFQYILFSSYSKTTENTSFPIKEISDTDIIEKIVKVFDTQFKTFISKKNDSSYTFPAMVSDAYDIISEYAQINTVIEKNIIEIPYLQKAYTNYRNQFFCAIETYIEFFAKTNAIRTIEDKALATVFFIETIATWAMHIPYTAFEQRNDITAQQRKNIAQDMIVHAFQ